MNVAIFGGAGNMGTRYAKIIRELGHKAIIYDINAEEPEASDLDCVIVTLPTDAHLSFLAIGKELDIPILCEKPISRYAGVMACLEGMEAEGVNLQMVDQYAFCPRYKNETSGDVTIYHSWHSGGDTLPWDCINIIAKANDLSKCSISNTAPRGHWECAINGESLKLEDMAGAYKAMIASWLKDPIPNFQYMKHAHNRVLEFIECKKTAH